MFLMSLLIKEHTLENNSLITENSAPRLNIAVGGITDTGGRVGIIGRDGSILDDGSNAFIYIGTPV